MVLVLVVLIAKWVQLTTGNSQRKNGPIANISSVKTESNHELHGSSHSNNNNTRIKRTVPGIPYTTPDINPNPKHDNTQPRDEFPRELSISSKQERWLWNAILQSRCRDLSFDASLGRLPVARNVHKTSLETSARTCGVVWCGVISRFTLSVYYTILYYTIRILSLVAVSYTHLTLPTICSV